MRTRPLISVLQDYDALSRAAADLVAAFFEDLPAARVVAATGDTPLGLYRELALRVAAGDLDASRATVYQLDEYAGIEPDDPRSLTQWTRRAFLEPLRIPSENLVELPRARDAAACAAYDRAVEDAGGYDLAILGIGRNGHLGFNEPPVDASAPTRTVSLTPASIASSEGYWGSGQRVPGQAVTIGMAGLLQTRTIVLLASGTHKRDIVRRALLGPVTAEVPASYLQTAGNVTVLLDREAWG